MKDQRGRKGGIDAYFAIVFVSALRSRKAETNRFGWEYYISVYEYRGMRPECVRKLTPVIDIFRRMHSESISHRHLVLVGSIEMQFNEAQ